MAELKTKQGEIFVIDDEDLKRVGEHTWVRYPSCRYIQASIDGVTTSVHRFVMRAAKGSTIDHINGDRFDNRKSNLRFCNHSENMCNTGSRSNSKSGYKGVHQLPNGKYRAKIDKDGVRIGLGVYSSLRDAVVAYNAAAKVLHGEFAYMNSLPENTRHMPEGYALVPVEPTGVMREAGNLELRHGSGDPVHIYKAMIKAAQNQT